MGRLAMPHGDVHLGATNSANDTTTIHVDGGTAIEGTSTSGFGVVGSSEQSVGVVGKSNEASGVSGSSEHGAGVQGTTGEQAGVVGFYGPTVAVGVWPVARTGVFGWAHDPHKSSVGVRGSSENGRGGVFEGLQAQVRLLPSTAKSHPTSGQMGDLFVDKNGRLWFCKGGQTWVQLA
jgi:hypothetical protein